MIWVPGAVMVLARPCSGKISLFDVVKTRLQAIKKADGEKEFKGISDCIT